MYLLPLGTYYSNPHSTTTGHNFMFMGEDEDI
jgi:hypothetical protein